MDEVRKAELWAGRWGCGVALGEQKGGAHKLTPGQEMGQEGPEWTLRGLRPHSPGAWDLEDGSQETPQVRTQPGQCAMILSEFHAIP